MNAVREEGEVKTLPAIAETRAWVPSAVVLTAFAIIFALITVTSFLQKSPTADEPFQLFAGYSYLKWGDFRTNPEHPPLAKLWAALPLLALDLKAPRQSSHYGNLIPRHSPDAMYTLTDAAEMLFVLNNATSVFFYAKLQMIVLGIILGFFVYLWSKELFGFHAAVASLFLYCFDPNILAHSQFVHTDVAFTAMFFVGSYFFWRGLDKLTWSNLVFSSLFFGLAAITKYAYLAVIVVWSVLGLARILSRQPQLCTLDVRREVSSRWGKAALLSGVLLCSLVTAYFFIWLAYGFRFDAIATEGRHLAMAQQLPKNPYLLGLINFLTRYRLFPEAWIYGQLYVFNNLQREAYLMGSYSDGFWLYYPIAFAVKTPVPTLLLLMGSIWLWISQSNSRRWGLFLLIPVVVYFSLAVWSRINIGVRHILPIYPFLFVLLGSTVAELWNSGSRVKRAALVVLASWYIWSAISIYPHYLAFFNEVAGGPENGHKWLLDSNLDWGQDLKGLKRWMDQNRVKKIQFLYFGFHDAAEPKSYGIDAVYLPGSWVAPDSVGAGSENSNILAISANHLYGHFLNGERREDFVKPFRSLRPAAIIGHSIYVYRIDDAIKQLRKAVEIHPTSGQAHADLASLLENQKNMAEAVEHYREAIQFNPPPTKALYNLGIILAKQGNLDEASKLLRRATESSPLDSDIHYDLAQVLAMRGNLDDVIEQLRATIEIDPTSAGAYYNLGMLLATKGHIEEAIASVRKSLSIDPTQSKAHYYLGVMSASKGNIEEAINQLRQALQIEPEFAEAHENLARALALQGKRSEAVAHYEEAVRILKSRASVKSPR